MSFDEFKNSFMQSYRTFLDINKLQKLVLQTEGRISVLNSAIQKVMGSSLNYPIIVGNSLSRASICDLGSFPPVYVSSIIYPNGYQVKKRFKSHLHYKKSLTNKVLYICQIVNDRIVITADDGYEWMADIDILKDKSKYDAFWDNFKKDLGIENEFGCLEDFMALTNLGVIKLIEALWDVSKFEGYVMLSQRAKE